MMIEFFGEPRKAQKRGCSSPPEDRGMAMETMFCALYTRKAHLLSEQSTCGSNIASPWGGLAMHGAAELLVPCGGVKL